MLPLFLKAKVVQIKETTKKKIKKDDCYIHMPQSLKNLREFNKYNKTLIASEMMSALFSRLKQQRILLHTEGEREVV